MEAAGEVPVKPRIFLAACFVLGAAAWVLVPTGFVRGIVFGAAMAPLVIVGSLWVYSRYLVRKPPNERFSPRVPIRKWSYDLAGVSLDGQSLSGSDLKGRVAVVNYWPASREPDFEEIAGLARLRTATEDLPVEVFCIVERSQEEVEGLLAGRDDLGVPVYRFEGQPPIGYRDLPMGMTLVIESTGVVATQCGTPGIWDDDAVIAFVRALATGVQV